MSRIHVHGCGAVSPAGWSMAALRESVAQGTPLPTGSLSCPGRKRPLQAKQVPAPKPPPEFLRSPRLRRASPISHYAVSAALEALGTDAAAVAEGKIRLGVVLCVMSGCVNYSRRFYDEALRDPSTASPLVFPETVFNAPASHLAALLGTPALNYTLVGDPGTFLQGMALAADWLGAGYVDGCLVVGAEESDWMTSNGFHLFSRRIVISEGAGAIYLKPEGQAGALGELDCVTDSHSYGREQNRSLAARKISEELPAFSPGQVLIDGLQDAARLDAAETAAWSRWDGPRFSPKLVLGDGMMAGVAWQCALAVDAVAGNAYRGATVSVVGCNQQAIGAHFVGVNGGNG